MRTLMFLLCLPFVVACADDPIVDPPIPDPGTGAADVACPGSLESCGISESYEIWCADGIVTSHDLTSVSYCKHGETMPVCSTEHAPETVRTCATACANTDVHVFELWTDYQGFDTAALCQ